MVIFSLLLGLRIIYACHFRFDTDEPQHLHVVWGWATGHLQYRDVFDNHGPIFHLLCVPLFRILGERPDILIPMRLAMIPLFAISLWCTYRIGSALFSRQAGLWAAILTGFYPEFFLTSTEFRTDNLWTVLWLLALVVATPHPLHPKRAFIVGLLLGAASAVTVKTGLMVGSLALASAVIIGSDRIGGKMPDWRSIRANVFAGVSGFAIVPCLVILFFAAHGAARELFYCNITHNLVPHAQNWEHLDAHVLWFPIFAAIILGVLGIVEHQTLDAIAVRKWCLVLTAGLYFTALKTFFPTLSRQDDMPVIPLACLIFVSWGFLLQHQLTDRPRLRMFSDQWLFPTLLAAEVIGLLVAVPFWKNNTQRDIAMVADVLRATKPGDFVMDATGETIFRMRPYYYALEAFTKVRIEHGLLKDDIAERLVATTTALVRPDSLTSSSQAFVRSNYVRVGNGLYILGQQLPDANASEQKSIPFEVTIPATYTVLGAGGQGAFGDLDGAPLNGPRTLASGRHVFVRTDGQTGTLFLFWSDGFRRGFSPFKRR